MTVKYHLIKVQLPTYHIPNIAHCLIPQNAKAKDFPDFKTETGFRAPQADFIDNILYDGTQPNAYINSFKIGLKKDDKL